MKLDESLSPSLFTLLSHFAAIPRDWYYESMTAPCRMITKPKVP
jgi:hypothetical protein